MMVDLITVKKSFSTVVEDVPPWIFSHFMMWLDLKVAEYKVYGYMLMDEESKKTGHSSRKRNEFVRFFSETGPHQSNRTEGSKQRLSDGGTSDDNSNISTSKAQTTLVQHSATTPAFSSPLKRTGNISQETRFGQKPSSQSETKTSDQLEINRNNITTLDFSDMKIDPQTETQVSQSEWSESVVPLDTCVYKSDQSVSQQRTGSFLQHETKFDQDIKDVNVQHDSSLSAVFSDSVQSQNESDIPFKQPRVEAPSAIATDHQSNRNVRSNPETSTTQRSFGQGSSFNAGVPVSHSQSKDNVIFSASHSVGSNSGQLRNSYTTASGETSFMVCDARTMHPIWHSQANETMSTTGQFGDRAPHKSDPFSQGSNSSGYQTQTQKSQVQSGNSPIGDVSSLQTLIKIEIDSDESQEPCMMIVSQSADKTGSQTFYHPGTEHAGQPFSSGTSQTQNQTLYLEPISGTTSDEGINQLIGEVTHPSDRDMQSTSAHDDNYGQLTPIYDSSGVRIGYRRKLHKDPVTGKYSCLQCGAQFANQSSLSRHRALHGEKKHSYNPSSTKITSNTKHQTLEDAITAVQEGGMSQRMATRVFGVPRTTLQYHLNRSKLHKGDNSSSLPPDSDEVHENLFRIHAMKTP